MPAKILVPELGESVLEATVGHWQKQEGDHVSAGEVLVSLETDKVDLEVGAERDGVLARIERREGEDVKIGDVLGVIDDATNGSAARKPEVRSQPSEPHPIEDRQPEKRQEQQSRTGASQAVPAPAEGEPPASAPRTAESAATPSARRLARERGIDLARVPAGAPGGRLTKEDVESHASTGEVAAAAPAPRPAPTPARPESGQPAAKVGDRAHIEDRERMSRRRQTIARRLVEAQHTAAMLTTFNEIEMGAVMELRRRQKETFKERHGVGLGITSFFVKAAIAALRKFPKLNAEIDGDEIVLKRYYDIGVAVGASEGLVVPVLRDADHLSFAEIEKAVKEFARKAEDHTLSLDDLRGGTFTITNGGVFGSLMSTPILNPPQVGILGLHKIQERPVSLGGSIVSRPMMYVALSYDHRLVDGLEAVQFLVAIKQLIEDPGSLLIES